MVNASSGQTNGKEQGGTMRGMQSSVMEEGERLMDSATERARDAQAKVSERADDAMACVGDKMSSAASTLRQKGPKDGRMGSAVEAVADKLESSGQYLSENGVSDIAQDITGVVKRYPIHSLWIGLGIGYLIGNFAGSSKRY